jgi:hypothetical protein
MDGCHTEAFIQGHNEQRVDRTLRLDIYNVTTIFH